jgi:hypothetical protein
MAISRSLMNRQLRANGGIMQVAPREKFGLGSKLKKFVRKIIPNEISEIAVTAAPFVAPFNPLLAAGMSGLGSFDQTGRIGDSLKRGALTYGLGQGARYLGGADFQGLQNPFAKDAFSMPTGSGGIKNLFKDKVQPVEGVGETILPKQKPNILTEQMSEISLPNETIVDATSNVVKPSGSAMESLQSVVSFDTSAADKGKAALDLLKRGSNAIFRKSDGSIDKYAVFGAATFALSYAEAKALAAQAGVELTEEEYDQAQRDEKKEEYAGYLQNFFGGKKDGGRIGFESGANEMIKTQLLEDIMPETTTEDFVIIMTEDGPVKVKKSDLPPESMMMDTSTGFGTNITRVDRKFGSPKEGEAEIGIMSIDVEAGDDEDEEDMMMAGGGITFTSAEKSYLFRRLGGAGGPDRSFTMPQLYGILKNPNSPANIDDAKVLKQIAIMGLEGRKDGGRIGYKDGANRVSELLITRAGILAQDPDADVSDIDGEIFQLTGKTFKSIGGISDIPTGKIRKNNAGVVERDYRDEGGFVPVGIKERADDVPAMLSKNEFVMTADAVRGIGNGSVEEGSKKLYNTMKKAEQVGKA